MRQDLPGEGKRPWIDRCDHVSADQYRAARTQDFQTWTEITGVAALAYRRYPAQAARIASITAAQVEGASSKLLVRCRVSTWAKTSLLARAQQFRRIKRRRE
jgi:hypothetical protein